MSRDSIVFASISAQEDNLGDIEIRRAALEQLLNGASSATVYAGPMSDGYVAAFRLPDGVGVVRDPQKFIAALLRSLFKDHVIFLLSPGPYSLSGGGKHMIKSFGIGALAALIRATGGEVYSLGRAFRGHSRWGIRLQKFLARISKSYSLRDTKSLALVGGSAILEPDLGFSRFAHSSYQAPESVNFTERSKIAISIRSDQAVADDAVGVLVSEVRRQGREPIFYTQVKRDNERHVSWGIAFDAAVLEWTNQSHEEQRARVDELLSSAEAVVSNRLHGLVFGLTCGAAAIEVSDGESDKIQSTLLHLGVLSGSVDCRRPEGVAESVASALRNVREGGWAAKRDALVHTPHTLRSSR